MCIFGDPVESRILYGVRRTVIIKPLLLHQKQCALNHVPVVASVDQALVSR